MLRRFEDNTCSVILNFSGVYLKGTLGFQQKESYSNRKSKSTNQGCGCVNKKIMAYGTDSAELQVFHSANAKEMAFDRRSLVENNTEAANSWRKGNY